MKDERMAARADLPGKPASVWLATTPETTYEPLDSDRTVETAVIGGGIAGLTTATLLAEAGRDVVLLERDRIGCGVTGHTTAKVTSQHGLVYASLINKHDTTTAAQYGEANQTAVEFVADRVAEQGIDCDFRRLPAYTYTESTADISNIRAEVNAAREIGLPASYTEDVSVADTAAAIRFADQAVFNPRQYVLALADAYIDAGGRICEETRAIGIDDGSPCRVETNHGTVTADDIVVATHFPILDRAGYFVRQYPKRSYVLAVRATDPPSDGMYYRSGSPYLSVRTAEIDGETLTLVGGQNHKTGQGGSTSERYHILEQVAQEHFDVKSVVYRWATQDYVSIDGIPYIGHLGPFKQNIYVITGFGGWGLSAGTAAGIMLRDAIMERPNLWLETFDPLRTTVRASAHAFVEENANVAKQFIGDWTDGLQRRDLSALDVDEAMVCRQQTDVLGIYRDETGDLHAVNAVCPHLGCLVQWNDGERTWDCPCHGSRFEIDGRVINGPANTDLSQRDL